MSVTLETDCRLSESSLWRMQRDFYHRQGLKAWDGQLPFYATSNPFLADAYAQMIVAAMRDVIKSQPDFIYQRFYILELGGGCGQLAFYILRALNEHLSRHGLEDVGFCYVLSDIAESIISVWEENPLFAPFIEKGQLDFSCFNALSDETVVLRKHGIVLEDNSQALPLIIIANYVFDSLPADLFTFEDGEMRESCVSLFVPEAAFSEGVVQDFSKLDPHFLSHSLAKPPYENLCYRRVLSYYESTLLDSHVLFPIAALNLMERFRQRFSAGTLWLVADKAYTSLEQLDHLEHPEFTAHGGAFSMMVNYDAIARYTEFVGGQAFLESPSAGIKLGVFAFSGMSPIDCSLKVVLARYLNDFTPAHYIHLHRSLLKRAEYLTLETLVAHLALSHWDPVSFKRAYPHLYQQLDGADLLTVNHLVDHLPLVAANFFNAPGAADIFFDIAVIFHTLKRYDKALTYYQKSQGYFGKTFGLCFNAGICAYQLQDRAQAVEYFKQAKRLKPEANELREWESLLA